MKAITKIIIISILGIAVSSLLYIFLIAPLLSEVDIINSLVRIKKTELAVLQKQITAFKTAQSDLAKAVRKEDLMLTIPEKEELVLSVLDLEKASTVTNSEHGLSIAEVTGKDKKPQVAVVAKKVGIEEVGYDLKVKNDFTGMVNFINYLEHLPHFTELSKITLLSDQIKGGTAVNDPSAVLRSGSVNADLDGVFFIKQQ
ncbi:MAG: hypothetical protein KW804_01145 [Candidatus Doudnabacteria bacterium]|nr:hypothetical protein [Candidatus Doudnabacteria bacterium]